MTSSRAAILAGVKAAHSLHRTLGIREYVEKSNGRIDVFGTVVKLGAALVFQQLDRLLGAFLPEAEPGVLITSKRPLSVQRFTAAHELGHMYMRHRLSLDDDGILRRAPFSTSARADSQEQEADAFASTFLVPSWLVAVQMERQRWKHSALADPRLAYQASLRFGTSYRATCYALERHKVISRPQCAQLLKVEPREIKRALLDGFEPPDWWGDVWVLTEGDEGTLIEGGRNDLFVLRLRENSGAGYLWSFEELEQAGFAIVRDEREGVPPESVGVTITRTITARSEDRVHGEVRFRERRPWLPLEALAEYRFRYDLRGPEEPGMWDLRRLLQAA